MLFLSSYGERVIGYRLMVKREEEGSFEGRRRKFSAFQRFSFDCPCRFGEGRGGVRGGGGKLLLKEREVVMATALGKDGGRGLDEHQRRGGIGQEAAGERRGLRGAVATDELEDSVGAVPDG